MHDQRLEQPLRGRSSGRIVVALELLVEHALVRRMRVDNDEPLAVLRQDVQAMQLRQGNAERLLERLGQRLGHDEGLQRGQIALHQRQRAGQRRLELRPRARMK